MFVSAAHILKLEHYREDYMAPYKDDMQLCEAFHISVFFKILFIHLTERAQAGEAASRGRGRGESCSDLR